MTNRILFISSILCGLMHWKTASAPGEQNALPFFQRCVWSMGILTSMANHGMTHPFIRFADRAWMVVGLTTDVGVLLLFHPSPAEPMVFLGMAMSSFGLARVLHVKQWKTISNVFHVMSHLSLTFSHLLLI